MVICKKLDTSLYKQDAYLIIADNGKEVSQYINTKFTNIDKCSEDERCRGFQWKTYFLIDGFEKARFFIYTNTKEVKPNNTTILHELLHLTWDILDHVGIDLTADNHEAQTYLLEHLVKQTQGIENKLPRTKTNKKKK